MEPGTWLDPPRLRGNAKMTDPRDGCGCRIPLVWDGNRGVWRHLDDGSPCVAASPEAGR
jgi:hypothetical protein